MGKRLFVVVAVMAVAAGVSCARRTGEAPAGEPQLATEEAPLRSDDTTCDAGGSCGDGGVGCVNVDVESDAGTHDNPTKFKPAAPWCMSAGKTFTLKSKVKKETCYVVALADGGSPQTGTLAANGGSATLTLSVPGGYDVTVCKMKNGACSNKCEKTSLSAEGETDDGNTEVDPIKGGLEVVGGPTLPEED